jgi:hypothetical protein
MRRSKTLIAITMAVASFLTVWLCASDGDWLPALVALSIGTVHTAATYLYVWHGHEKD